MGMHVCTVLMTAFTFSLFLFKSSSEIFTDLLEKAMANINDNLITNVIMWCDIECRVEL